ncbi:MAG: tRNA pseudouridine(38-40) synthase TruA [Planctomycetota bacterium]|jgi:tRNA pseudouridine38-40 synthase|nr:tRNA pseudouridine(38-40) synthase TruA [Planctomycetota bacterium]
MRSLKFTIEYDGTNFCGWQIQPNGRSVQAEIERVLTRLTGAPARLYGAGRTDAGVHARGQVAVARVASPIPTANFVAALNGLLPDDVAVRAVAEVPENFNPRHDAKRKLYRYTLWHAPSRPALDRRVWRVPYPLDFAAMRGAAAALLGEHDFTSLSNQQRAGENNVRAIDRCDLIFAADYAPFDREVSASGGKIFIEVEGRSFLYNMVRNIAGLLVDVGRGRFAAAAVPAIIAAKARARAGQSAPAAGLCLEWVKYE